MTQKKRNAVYQATLVFLDEPQLIHLRAGKTNIMAIAIPSEDPAKSEFFATTVSPKDWEAYWDGIADLLYLFTFPSNRLCYRFDLMKMKDNKVRMEPAPRDVPPEYLPEPRFFSYHHTDLASSEAQADPGERLIVDGEWDMSEFGQFYQRYSEIYAFLHTVGSGAGNNYVDKLQCIVKEKPFKGGFSYVNLYQELRRVLPRKDRLGLREIQYASPGHISVNGNEHTFREIRAVVANFLRSRTEILKHYGDFHGYLSKHKYLAMDVAGFDESDPNSAYFFEKSKELTKILGAPEFSTIKALSKGNALVCSKIVLSFCRRVQQAAEFYAQGRVTLPSQK